MGLGAARWTTGHYQAPPPTAAVVARDGPNGADRHCCPRRTEPPHAAQCAQQEQTHSCPYQPWWVLATAASERNNNQYSNDDGARRPTRRSMQWCACTCSGARSIFFGPTSAAQAALVISFHTGKMSSGAAGSFSTTAAGGRQLARCELSGCGKRESVPSEFQRCSLCKQVKYCCRDHQKKAWTSHKATTCVHSAGANGVPRPHLHDATAVVVDAGPASLPALLYPCAFPSCNKHESKAGEFLVCSRCSGSADTPRYCRWEHKAFAAIDHRAECAASSEAVRGAL